MRLLTFYHFVGKDRFVLMLFSLGAIGMVNILASELNLPFAVLCGSILYKAHIDFRGKKSVKSFHWIVSLIVFIILLCLALVVQLVSEGYSPRLAKTYELAFLFFAGASLVFYPVQMYTHQSKIKNSFSERNVLLNQLSIISVISGLTTFVPLASYVYPVDFDIPPAQFILLLIGLSMLLIGRVLYKEWIAYQMGNTAVDRADDGLTAEEIALYGGLLDQYVGKDSLYLRPDLSLDLLSVETGIPKYKLTQYLNQHLGKTFYRFIAEHRIRYAIANMNGDYQRWTIEALATTSGFNSVTTFNKYFKEYTGCTPGEYRGKERAT